MTAARKFKTTPVRRGLIAKVKIAQKQLGLDDDTYRAKIAGLYGGKTSATQLNIGELEDLVRQLKAEGATFTKRKAPARAGKRPLAAGDMQGKMRALWISLYHLGIVRDPAEAALVNFARRVSGGRERGIAALQWLDGEQANKVIEALKDWAVREAGVVWDPQHTPRHCVIEAQKRILTNLGPNLGPNLGVDSDTDLGADRLIEALGARIRKALAVLGHQTLKDWKQPHG